MTPVPLEDHGETRGCRPQNDTGFFLWDLIQQSASDRQRVAMASRRGSRWRYSDESTRLTATGCAGRRNYNDEIRGGWNDDRNRTPMATIGRAASQKGGRKVSEWLEATSQNSGSATDNAEENVWSGSNYNTPHPHQVGGHHARPRPHRAGTNERS